VLPRLAEQSAALFGQSILSWESAQAPLVGVAIAPFSHLMQRVDPKRVKSMVAASTTAEAQTATPSAGSGEDDGSALEREPLAAECTVDDFTKVDLRVARVIAADAVPNADKLLKLTVSLGGGHTRTVFAGIKAAYEPTSLVGRLVVVAFRYVPFPPPWWHHDGGGPLGDLVRWVDLEAG
jgi:methionyl-tRNA synthetase